MILFVSTIKDVAYFSCLIIGNQLADAVFNVDNQKTKLSVTLNISDYIMKDVFNINI